MAKRIISLRNNEAIVKIEGAVGANTIALATDLLGANELIQGTPSVTIVGITWTTNGGNATIVRNGVTLATCVGPTGSLTALNYFFENGNPTFDIVVTSATAEVQIWLKLHKNAGYQTKYTIERDGSYNIIP